MEQDRKEEKPRRGRKRFSFVIKSILVVFIVIIAGFVAVSYLASRRFVTPGSKVAVWEIENFKTALGLYFTDNGTYPTTAQGLQSLVTAPTPAPKNYPPDGYLSGYGGDVPSDPWGHAFIYRSPGRNRQPYTIVSYGADGSPGGEGEDADIESWNLHPKKIEVSF